MKVLATISMIVSITVGSAAHSQDAVSAAVETWLGGDEAQSLQTLSDAARTGNTDAQLLLGQIDRDTVPGGFSEYLINLSDDDRAFLLRSAAQGDDVNWLLTLSDPSLTALGEALFGYKVGRDPIGNALALQEVGEPIAAEFVLWNTVNNGRFDLVNSMPAENFGLSDAGFLQWIGAYVADPNKSLTISRIIRDQNPAKVPGLLALKRLARVLGLNQYFSPEVDEFLLVMLGRGYDLSEDTSLIQITQNISEIAEIDDPLSIVTRFCDKCSAGEVDYDCIIQALEIVNGYKTLLSIRTPVENVIPAGEYFTSDRPVAIFERLLASRAHYYPREIRSQCLMEFLSEN